VDRTDRIQPAHPRHLQVHESDIGSMSPELLDVESALPNAHRQLIFAALTSYASEPMSTATRAAVVDLKTSGNWKN
jgi:hypothetical protein